MNEMTPAESNAEDTAREGRGRVLEDDILQIQVREKTLTPTFILLCIAVLMSSLGALGIYLDNQDDRKIIQQTSETAKNTNKVVQDIERRQAPEALAEQQSEIDAIILRVECNERRVLEDFTSDILIAMTEAGVLPETATITLEFPPECEPFTPPPGG